MQFSMIIPLFFKSIIQAANVDIRLSRSFFILIYILFTLAFSSLASSKVNAQENDLLKATSSKSASLKNVSLSSIEVKDKQLPNHLSEKFYRQALYFYFQNKPEEALRQLDINQDYFSQTPVHASLFRAGLQISQGLNNDAQVLLTQLSTTTESTTTDDDFLTQNLNKGSVQDTIENNLKIEALKVIVFLQLAEQKIAEHNLSAAQPILAKITALPKRYLGQYYVLQQLIAWPKQPDIETFALDEESKKQLNFLLNLGDTNLEHQDNSTAYILLNEALSAMNQRQFSLAEEKLKRLKLFTWQVAGGFWQRLFANENTLNKTLTNSKQIEHKGINHYAQLLLAQLYIEQGLFQQGYEQLESFPKNTPFTEHALFLYGYSAFKLQQYNVSDVILSTLITQYPYSNFTQQAWLLSAEQYTAQNQFNNALNRYLHIEEYYQTKQQELSAFTNILAEQKDLLPFYRLVNESNVDEENSNNVLWLTLSLRQTDIASLYQQLQSVEQLTNQLQEQLNKSGWLASTIELNKVRKNNIREKQKNTNYPRLLKQLTEQQSQLVTLLDKAESLGNGELFANQREKKLLARIEKSKNALAFIEENKQESRSTVAYQQRLSRVQGVLSWQLQQAFPNRYWQTRESLNEFERTFNKTRQQHEKVTTLLSQQGSLTQVTEKHDVLNRKITALLNKTSQIKTQINTTLLNGMTQFIENEHSKIAQFLLFNQRAMASVIEKLNQQEAL